ncbi:Response regulator receiver domain-containing protein [Desulfocicer vacuolatum DSM 3385]|uniref:Response regulator receiver domain-containing protein n=1 Tax=Desulfocicer vacuolatum DSM 3385 TaxID=1121400 RepID=A0A1W1ZSC2_9BACT|nr:diguanylate cyclase [Desulfocicer vacuolatum]SMC51307.1 Response regulator receiver domain-containing protein [Desulfocicer vacuolatum DSM 3385]
MNEKLTVLVGEDPAGAELSIQDGLEKIGMRCLACSNGIDLVRRAILKNPDIIVMDVALPRMNGYQCARILRHDSVTRNTPIIHLGANSGPVDRYWSKVCGGNLFLDVPLESAELHSSIHALVPGGGVRPRPVTSDNVIPEMTDQSILGLATNLLEQDLLKLNILKEINMVDSMDNSPGELFSSLFAIINSLYPFSSGSVLLVYDNHVEFYFCGEDMPGKKRSSELKTLILDQLRHRQDIRINPDDIVDVMIESDISAPSSPGNEDVYVHIGENQGAVRIGLAFENIHLEAYNRDEKSIFYLALELIRGVIEKKIFFRMNQELSLIDIATQGYSITFFMEVLGREMENATRHNYTITLFTMLFANFATISREMDSSQLKALLMSIQTSILRSMRKTDVVARWNQANFAFLLTHTTLEGSREAMVRVKKTLLSDLAESGIDVGLIKLMFGACQFNAVRDKTAENFFKNAMPRKQ